MPYMCSGKVLMDMHFYIFCNFFLNLIGTIISSLPSLLLSPSPLLIRLG